MYLLEQLSATVTQHYKFMFSTSFFVELLAI